MICNACGWNRANVSSVSFCPDCGSDSNLSEEPDAMVTCTACLDVMLYWQTAMHTCPEKLSTTPAKPVDNFLRSQRQ